MFATDSGPASPDPQTGPDLLFFERILWDQGLYPLAGVDEVGRGCLAGPVTAAAVILPRDVSLPGVADSKTLSPEKRTTLDKIIRQKALAVCVSEISPEEIDTTNILKASLKAMARAVEGLGIRPMGLLVDGNQVIPHNLPQKTLVKGDARSLSIAAASIVAKVGRDRLMERMHEIYPEYNFARHKGYGTAEHRGALKRHGCCPIHRKTFKGVREAAQRGTFLPGGETS